MLGTTLLLTRGRTTNAIQMPTLVVLGKTSVVLAPTFRTADVYAYDTSIKPIENVPIVSGATAYDDPVSGLRASSLSTESLYYGEALDHTLINPNQVRSYGIPFWDNPFDPTRSLSIDVHDDLHIPLRTFRYQSAVHHTGANVT
jgi:hypothetical protein